MRNPTVASVIVLTVLLTVVALAPATLAAQGSGQRAQSSNVARTPDGQPDIQGFWGDVGVDDYDLEYGFSPISLKILGREARPFKSVIVDPADGKIPYQPWAAAQAKETREHHVLDKPNLKYVDPLALCYLTGVPRANYELAWQIVQRPGSVVMISENNHSYRIIYLDQRPRLAENVKLWMGEARGRWEGNTLVVETTNLNDKTWFDIVGAFHSDSLRVVERYTVVDRNRMNYEVTITDPKVFTRPWKIAYPMERNQPDDYEFLEHACHEGNKFEADVRSR